MSEILQSNSQTDDAHPYTRLAHLQMRRHCPTLVVGLQFAQTCFGLQVVDYALEHPGAPERVQARKRNHGPGSRQPIDLNPAQPDSRVDPVFEVPAADF
jgi:hypothetical protein